EALPRPAVGLVDASHGDEDDEVSDVGGRDELLHSVDHPVVAVAHRAGRDRPGIRPGARLGQREGVLALAADAGLEVFLDLLVAALEEDAGYSSLHAHD